MAEDAMEIALADGWHDPVSGEWDTEEHRELVYKANSSCPADAKLLELRIKSKKGEILSEGETKFVRWMHDNFPEDYPTDSKIFNLTAYMVNPLAKQYDDDEQEIKGEKQ